MRKRTQAGYQIKATAFLPVDMNNPETVAAMPGKIAALADAMRSLGFTELGVVPTFRQRRVAETETQT